MVKRLLKEHELDETRFSPKSIQWYINGHKDEGRRAKHVDHHDDPYEKTIPKVNAYSLEFNWLAMMLKFVEPVKP